MSYEHETYFFPKDHHLGVLFDTYNIVTRRLEHFLEPLEIQKIPQKQLFFAKIANIPFRNPKGIFAIFAKNSCF